MNKKILITGATGNVGIEVIRFIFQSNPNFEIVAGVRDIEKSRKVFAGYQELHYRHFDFEDAKTYDSAFEGVDILFLLRPPQIADVDKIFRPMIDAAWRNNIRKVVFLSVQGADKTGFIPHAKIEKLLLAKGFEYIFLRPSYFMQNLTTTLAEDVKAGKIVLPAGNAKFNWVDVANIGEVAAKMFLEFDRYKNQALEITGSENLSFAEAVSIINSTLGLDLVYESPNLLKFYHYKRKQGVSKAMVMVIIMLHFLPRFQRPPHISDNYLKIMGKYPTLLSDFAKKEMAIYGKIDSFPTV